MTRFKSSGLGMRSASPAVTNNGRLVTLRNEFDRGLVSIPVANRELLLPACPRINVRHQANLSRRSGPPRSRLEPARWLISRSDETHETDNAGLRSTLGGNGQGPK